MTTMLFGIPVTLTAALPDGEMVIVSGAIEITENGITIDPFRFLRIVNLARETQS